MRLIWKYFVPLSIVFWGVLLTTSEPNDILAKLFSIFREYRNYTGGVLIVAGFLLGVGIYRAQSSRS